MSVLAEMVNDNVIVWKLDNVHCIILLDLFSYIFSYLTTEF